MPICGRVLFYEDGIKFDLYVRMGYPELCTEDYTEQLQTSTSLSWLAAGVEN